MTTRHTIMGSIRETLEAGEQNSIDERENILKRLRSVIWKHLKEKGYTVSDEDGISRAKSSMAYRYNKVVEFKQIAHIANIIWIQRSSLQTIDDFFDEPDPLRNIEKQICRLHMMIHSHPHDINDTIIIINGEEIPLPDPDDDLVRHIDVTNSTFGVSYHKYLVEIKKCKEQIQSLQYTRAHPFVTAMMMKFPLLEDRHDLYHPSGSPLLCLIPETVASQQGVYLQKVDVSMTLPPSESDSNDRRIPEAFIGEYNQLFLKPTTRTLEDGSKVTCISE